MVLVAHFICVYSEVILPWLKDRDRYRRNDVKKRTATTDDTRRLLFLISPSLSGARAHASFAPPAVSAKVCRERLASKSFLAHGYTSSEAKIGYRFCCWLRFRAPSECGTETEIEKRGGGHRNMELHAQRSYAATSSSFA